MVKASSALKKSDPGFFTPSLLSKSSGIGQYSDLGEEDSGFRAVAAAIIDNFLTHPQHQLDLFTLLLAKHAQYFPEHQGTLRQLIRRFPMSELIPTLAVSLRQLAVDEMVLHPWLYRSAFMTSKGVVPPEAMRQSDWMHESAIEALANRLSIPIRLECVLTGKSLPKPLEYNIILENTAINPLISIRLQQDHYLPRLRLADRFIAVKEAIYKSSERLVVSDPSVDDIVAGINKEDKILLKLFDQAYHQLATMVLAGELRKQDLLTIYLQGLVKSDYLRGLAPHTALQHGTEAFFNEITKMHHHHNKHKLPNASFEEDIIEALVSVIARELSIGHLSTENVFAPLDNDAIARRLTA